MMSKNRSGGNGHPFLKPLLEWKKGEAALLTKTLYDTLVIQLIIHLMNSKGKPMYVKSILRYIQLTLSKVFERSTFRTIPSSL